MRQVLLAINGNIPTNLVFQYSVALCKRIGAELNILQFIKNQNLTQCFSSTKKQIGRLGKFLEDSFAGVAFAEHGEFYMADEIFTGVSEPLKDLLKVNADGVSLKVALSNGNPETELLTYVENHKKIVLTIFDPSKDIQNLPKQNLTAIEKIRKKLSIPLVIIKP